MDDDERSDTYSDESDSDNSQSRPNRFRGPPSTWRSLTEEDRAINTSLIQQRNEDLSIHLYNAHALKRRVCEAKEKEEPHDEFVPPKVWTAWPLPPEIVPREEDIIGEEDGFQEFTLKREERYRPSRELEDVLMGTTLRIAKERLEEREWAEDEEEPTEAAEEHDRSDGDDEQVPETAQNKAVPVLRPVISADDERSKELLRPTIRHNLARLDELLMALHHSRQACLRATSEESEARTDNQDQSEEENPETPIASPSKKRKPTGTKGRPRKYTSGMTFPEKFNITASASPSPSPAKKKQGRPKKEYPRLEDESDYEYIVRIARLRKQPIPPPPPGYEKRAPQESPSVSVRSTPSRASTKSPRKRPTAESDLKSEARWQTRDWSEVLGAAAIIGFPQDVIARATQRCANLFGEEMTMRTLDHNLPPKGELVTYVPGMNPPALEFPSDSSENEDEVDAEELLKSEVALKMASKGKMPDEVVLPHNLRAAKVTKETCWCAVSECPRSKHGFGRSNHLKRHLITQHDYDKSSPELEKAMLRGKNSGDVEEEAEPRNEEEEEIDGGVHIDGFMKIIQTRKGGRGKDVVQRKAGKRKRKRVEREAVRDEEAENEGGRRSTREAARDPEVNGSAKATKMDVDEVLGEFVPVDEDSGSEFQADDMSD